MAKLPPPVEGLGYCPLIKQQCIGDACALWVKMYGMDENGVETLDEDCTLNWSTLIARETLVETARVTAGHDKVANETHQLGTLIAVGIRTAQQDR